MELKDKIREIIAVVYKLGNRDGNNDWKIKDYAVNRIMELIEEEKEDTHESR